MPCPCKFSMGVNTALTEKDFGFKEFADALFGEGSFSGHSTSLQSLILTLHLDQFLGVRSQPKINIPLEPNNLRFELIYCFQRYWQAVD
jgi:hypothetical protein